MPSYVRNFAAASLMTFAPCDSSSSVCSLDTVRRILKGGREEGTQFAQLTNTYMYMQL